MSEASEHERRALRRLVEATIRRRNERGDAKKKEAPRQWIASAAYEVAANGEVRPLELDPAKKQWRPPAPPFPRRAGQVDPTWWES